MHMCRTIADIRTAIIGYRAAGETVSLVPTKGNLHAGHLALFAHAKTQAQRVVATILESPVPFRASGDFSANLRDLDHDVAMLVSAGVDAVFVPEFTELHPAGAQTIVETTDLARILMGKLRPGHFRGTTTMMTKLFNIIAPDVACFGQKDYQLLCVVRQMVRDLFMPVQISDIPTVREPDGLAISSCNACLTPEDRVGAAVLSRALTQATELAKTGITASRLRAWVAAHIQGEARADLQLADIRDARSLETLSGPLTSPAVILLAVRFGGVLLIDQCIVAP